MADPRSKSEEGKGLGRGFTIRWARVEFFALFLLTLLAGLIRFWRIQDIGLSHFDAGIYAQSALWPWTGGLHPQQGYYSPPLFPFLWGLLNFAAGGPLDWGGAAISAAAGTLLIPAGWYLGRQWFGILGGLAAATFLCFDGLQILFSRVALTDSLFTLLFVTTLGLGVKCVLQEQGNWFPRSLGGPDTAYRSRQAQAGLLSGLRSNKRASWNWRNWAWWALLVLVATSCLYTKYNGLMPIGLVGLYAFVRRPGLSSIKLAALILLPVLILYSPWVAWFHVQHGYETLLAHQRGYLASIEDWPANFLRMMRQDGLASYYSQVISTCLLAMILAILRKAAVGVAVLALFWAASTAMRGVSVDILFYIGLLGVICSRRPDRWDILVLGLGMIVAPIFYTPYLRLWLPSTGIWSVLAGGGVATVVRRSWLRLDSPKRTAGVFASIFVCSSIIIVARAMDGRPTFEWRDYAYRAYRPHAGYRRVAEEVAPKVSEGGTVYALTRPPVHYYLRNLGVEVVPLDGRAIDLTKLGPSDWLVVDRTIEDNPTFADTLRNAPAYLDQVSLPLMDIDLVTLLDASRDDADLMRSIPRDSLREKLVIYRRK